MGLDLWRGKALGLRVGCPFRKFKKRPLLWDLPSPEKGGRSATDRGNSLRFRTERNPFFLGAAAPASLTQSVTEQPEGGEYWPDMKSIPMQLLSVFLAQRQDSYHLLPQGVYELFSIQI